MPISRPLPSVSGH